MNLPPYGNEFRKENMPFSTLKVTAQSTPDMTVRVSPGAFWVNGKTLIEYVGGNSSTFTAPSANAKWCLLVLRQQGTLDIVDGVESSNPEFPDCPRTCLPLCAIYLQSTDTAITEDMINEIRPVYNISVQDIRDLDGLSSTDILPIASIVNLQTELNDRYTQTQVTNLLATKADNNGTIQETFVLNKDFTGTPASNCGIEVERGTESNAVIRYNETSNVWQYTNDGTVWVDLTNSGPGVPLATTSTAGTVIVSTGLLVDGSGNLSVENVFTSAEKTKLAGIEDNATADMTDAEIKTAYENNSNTNAYTDAEKTQVAKIDQSGDTSSRPSSPATGEMYFDTDLGYPIWYDGSDWVDSTGTTV